MPRFASSSSKAKPAASPNKKKQKNPKLSSPYAPAAHLLSQILDEKKSFKKLIYDKDGNLKCHKVTYAQVCQVLSYKSILDDILDQVPALKQNVHHSGLLHVLVYELLLGPNQAIRGGGAVKRQLLQHEPELQKAMNSPSIAQQLQDHDKNGRRQQPFPRYARVNPLMISLEEVSQTLLQPCSSNGQQATPQKNHQRPLEFYMDPHVPNLLVLPPSIVTEAMSSSEGGGADESSSSSSLAQQSILKSWIHSGKLILQDKSSCFPAFCLVHGFSLDIKNNDDVQGESLQDYLDACAAPGNKTQHLAAQLSSLGGSYSSRNTKTTTTTTKPTTVYALDRDTERLKSLQRRMQQLVPTTTTTTTNSGTTTSVQVVTRECDFLQTNPDDYPTVGAILLDPSCSGSGIQTAPDRWTDSNNHDNSSMEHGGDQAKSQRVESLAKFQEKALRHAMSFPNVSRIVYSTCSIHERENEQVVVNALLLKASGRSQDDDDDNISRQDWKIVAPICMESWKRRGHVVEGLSKEEAQCMIRCIAPEDETNGFFVCCLQRQMTDLDIKKEERKDPFLSSLVKTPKGTTLYNGQFGKMKNPSNATSENNKSPSKKLKSDEGSPNKPTKTSRQKKSKNEPLEEEAPKSEEQASATSEPIPKKVAKKLAWKKRQIELKQQRLKLKKQKTET